MNTNNNKEIIRRYVEEIENTGDVSKIQDFISEEYTEVYEGESYKIGIQGAIDHVLGIRRIYPDLKITIENQIAEGEWIATSISASGTFENEWFDGLKPTGKPITYRGVNVNRIKDGKIVEHGGAVNLLQPLMKAGVIINKK